MFNWVIAKANQNVDIMSHDSQLAEDQVKARQTACDMVPRRAP